MMRAKLFICCGLLSTSVLPGAVSNDAPPESATTVLWGDTHLHTEASIDASAFGNRLDRDTAYRFAKGEPVVSSTGQRARLTRSLDFLVIADHSDYLGFFPQLLAGTPEVMASDTGRSWHERLLAGDNISVANEIIGLLAQKQFPRDLAHFNDSSLTRSNWHAAIDAAERHNDPGRFTAFIGYEWTSLAQGNNLHRVVIYRDGAGEASQVAPLTPLAREGSIDPWDLWTWMAAYESKTGGEVLAIAHNGNLSNGVMFPLETRYSGDALDENYVRTRMRWEPLYEITQMKGDGETHPLLSPNDEFADFETWDEGNIDRSAAKQNEMLAGEYAREALKSGLKLEAQLGANPYQFGLVGSTDSHTSLSTAEENNYFGKNANAEPSAERTRIPSLGWKSAASGMAAVWATGNTRGEIFDAMKRRETYATTGPRMTVRFFAGWDFIEADLRQEAVADVGYTKGVPMGSMLVAAPAQHAPSFLVSAMKDPMGANLDRIQIVKGWLDEEGELHEAVYNVAWADERVEAPDGSLPPVGNTVDPAEATYSNVIGSPILAAVWRDPEFDPGLKSFYYARVLEIPTPRWTTYDAVRFGTPLIEEVDPYLQERAYTSPVWYSP